MSLTFPKSGSHAFSEVLQEASLERTFVILTSATGAERFRVSYGLDSIERYREIWAKIRHWKGVEHHLDGDAVPFDGCQEMLDCACSGSREAGTWCWGEGRLSSSLGSIAPLFPCRFIPLSEANHLGWFQYGSLNRDRVFVVDKIKLRQRVNHYLEKSFAHYCPLLDNAEIDQIIKALPQRIDPRQDESWVYKQGWIRGRYQTIGVEKKQQEQANPAPKAPYVPGGESGAPKGEVVPQHALGASETSPRLIDGREIPKVTYAEIGGLDSAIAQLREAVELPLKMPQLFTHLGISPHRGVLLYGPPGTGKTLLAKALANECEAHFALVNGPELLSKWHGETEANLRRLFEEARAKAPSVILFDEIDALTPHRDTVTHNFEAVLVSQLLSLMDGLVDRGNVVVIGTTNRPKAVDPALKRPGRLDLQLLVGLPDVAAREAILTIHSSKMPLAEDVSLSDLAARTSKYTGAMLAALCREAGMICLREQLQIGKGSLPALSEEEIAMLSVSASHFEQALAAGKKPKTAVEALSEG